ncbi:MAG: LysM peptidoglycan-binding domain-containing protein [Filomicrobium sp.]
MRGRLLCLTLLLCAVLGASVSFIMAGLSHGVLDTWRSGALKRPAESSFTRDVMRDARVLAVAPLDFGQWGRWQDWAVVNPAEAQDRESEQEINIAVPRPPKFARIVIKPERYSVFEGVGEPGQRIEVLVDQSDVRQTRVGGDGRWRVTGPALGPGDHRVEVSVGTPGQTRRVIGQRVRIAIPRTSNAREIVAYEQSEAERQAELRARAERLARDASREFDEFGRSSERSRTAKAEDRDGSARKRVDARRRQVARENGASSNGSDWLSRSARDYFDYVVPELARKGGDGSVAPRGAIPPPVRPGDDDDPPTRTTDNLPSIGDLAQGARDWLQRANRTYQDRVVEDLRVGSVDDNELRRREEQKARDRELAERRAARLRRAEEADRQRLEAEERRQRAEAERQRREDTLRLQAEEQRRIAEVARLRAEEDRRAAEAARAARLRSEEQQRLARLQEAEDEKRQLEEILARRKAEREALDAERRVTEARERERLESERLEQERQERIRLERERLAREQSLLEAERQRAEAARQEAERLRIEQERLQAEAEARAERERRMAEIAAAERQRLAEVEANRLAREQLLAERERAASVRQRDEEQLRRKELRVARIAELSDAAGFGAKEAAVERTPSDREDLAEKLERKAERTSIITRLMEDFRIADWRAVEPQLLREDGDRETDEVERRADEEDPPSSETVRRPSTAQQRPRAQHRTQPPQPEPRPRVARNDDARASRSSRPRRQAQPAPPTQSPETFRTSRSNVGGPGRYSVKDTWGHDGSRTAGWARRFPPISTGCADERAGRSIVPPGTYVVALGDTLWQISWKHYQRGDLYRKIYRANRRKIRSINRIYPCQKIFVPALSR